MLEGWKKANALPASILAYDAKPDAVASLQKSFPGVKAATLAEYASTDLVFGALHPPAMGEALEQIGKHLRPDAVFCSLAPVLRLPTLQQKLGGFSRIVRMNPNVPSIIGSVSIRFWTAPAAVDIPGLFVIVFHICNCY